MDIPLWLEQHIGAPLLGLHDKLPFRGNWADMYRAWIAPDDERAPVADMYRRINTAREASPELIAGKRYFLNTSSGGAHDRIFAVARWKKFMLKPITHSSLPFMTWCWKNFRMSTSSIIRSMERCRPFAACWTFNPSLNVCREIRPWPIGMQATSSSSPV